MFGEFYSGSHLLVWPLVGLGIFVVAFLAVLFYATFGLKRGAHLDRIAALPLEDDTSVAGSEGEIKNER